MQLIFIGESVKTIDMKTDQVYLRQYPQIPWKSIMGLRDINDRRAGKSSHQIPGKRFSVSTF